MSSEVLPPTGTRAPAGASLRGRLFDREPMARHCSWRTGGFAARAYAPADKADLAVFLATLPPEEPVTWIGLGSNVLIRDGGLRGTVIFTGPGLSCVETRGEDRMYVEAGVPCAKAARLAARAGLPGGEFLAGIPGTVGGALAMNAGAFGGEIWTLVTQVETVARDGQLRLRPSADYSVGYRTVRGPLDEWFVSCELRFVATATRDSGSRIRELLAQRNANQPQGVASCGSVFKNPPGDFAGRLIEAAGLKGARCGGCHVSHKHANFIINDDDATAADIERLITLVRAQVAEKFGVFLEPEVRILGEPAAAQSAGRGNE